MAQPTVKLLTMLKAKHNQCTTYELHKILGTSIGSVYLMAKGEREMDVDTLLVACDDLEIDPLPWLIQISMKRSRSALRRKKLQDMLVKIEQPNAAK